MLKRAFDFFEIFIKYPSAYPVFLRKQYDALFPVLSFFASYYRKWIIPKKKFIVVIGSLGKTTTRHTLRKFFLLDKNKQSFSNYGSCLAENVLRSSPADAYDVFEVGVDRIGEMAPYANLLRPDIVVVTSIKSDHNTVFPTLEDTRKEKVEMLKRLPAHGVAILNGDDPNVLWMQQHTKAKIVTFGFQPHNDFQAEEVVSNGISGIQFILKAHNKTHPLKIPLLGKHQVYAILAAVACAITEDRSMEDIFRQLPRLQAQIGRLEVIPLNSGAVVIDDSSKGGWESYESALAAFAQMPGKRKIAILGTVTEPPEYFDFLYTQLGEMAAAADHLIFIGDESLRKMSDEAHRMGMPAKNILLGSRISEAIHALKKLSPLKDGDLILIKGKGYYRYSRISQWLQGANLVCDIIECHVKVENCEPCPFISKDITQTKNSFIQKLVAQP